MTLVKRINDKKLKNQKITLTFDIVDIRKRTYANNDVDFAYTIKYKGKITTHKLYLSYRSKTIQELKKEIIKELT